MTTSSGFTVMFFFTNLRFGFSVVSGSVTAATTTERRALTALPGLAPKRACAVMATGKGSGQTGRRASRVGAGAAFPAADAGTWRRIHARISTDEPNQRRGASSVAGRAPRAYLDGRGHGGHGRHGGHVYENERRSGRCTRASGNARRVPDAEKRFSCVAADARELSTTSG